MQGRREISALKGQETFVRNLHGRATRVLLLFMAAFTVAAAGSLSTCPGSADSSGTRQVSYPQLINTGVGGEGYKVSGWTRNSRNSSISADGKWVVFQSQSSNLDELEIGEPKPFVDSGAYERDIFLHNIDTGSTVRVSKAWNGGKANEMSIYPSISSNGKWVVFESNASNLVNGDTNSVRDIFRYNRITGVLNKVSYRNGDVQTNKSSYRPSVDNLGAVVFHTKDVSMTPTSDTNNNYDVFLRKNGATTLVSKKADGSSTANQASTDGAISGDGSAIAFQSFADDLLPDPKGGAVGFDVYLYTVAATSNELVSVTPGNESGGSNSLMPSISENGDKVAFASYAKDLVSPELPTSQWRVFVRDVGVATASTEKITDSITDEASPSISPKGDQVAVERQGANIQIVVYDLGTGTSETASLTTSGDIADKNSTNPSLANELVGEHRVVFESDSNDLFHNYLGVGLLNWDELTAYKEIGGGNVGICSDGSYCYKVYVREMGTAPEPGLYDQDDNVEPEQLVSVDHNPVEAGQPTDVTVTLRRPQNYHEFKNVEFKMPVGIGASLDIPTCDKDSQAKVANCPPESKVGDVRADVAMLNSIQDIPAFFNVPKHGIDSRVPNCNKNWGGIPGIAPDFDGEGEPCAGSGVFFGTPEGDEAARLYAVIEDTDLLTDPVVVDLVVYLIEDEHYRVKVVSEIPNKTENVHVQQYKPDGTKSTDLKFQSNKVDGKAILNLNINRVEIVINGETSGGKKFMTNPTFNSGVGSTDPDIDQGQKKTHGKIETYGGTQMERNDLEFPVTNASDLPFDPTFDVDLFKTGTAQVAKPKEVVDVVAKVVEASGQSDIRETKVTFPDGVQVNSIATVEFCSWGDADFANCGPAGATDVGDVTVKTSALPEDLKGDVYLIDGLASGDPYTIAVFLDEYTTGAVSPVKLKLFGEVKLNQNRRIVAEFKDLPPYPLSEFIMSIDGLMTTNGVTCGSGTAELSSDTTITAWAKEIAPVSLKPKVSVNSDCTGAAQSSFAPKLSVTSDNHTVGASPGNLALSVKKDPADDPLTDLDLTLPHGMVGDLSATATKCTVAQAEGSGCPSSSKIGSVKATAQIFVGKTIQVEGGLFNATPGTGEFGRFIAAFDLPEIAGGEKLVLKSGVNPINNAQAIVTSVAGAPPEFNITDIRMNLHGKTASDAEGPLLMNPTFASTGSFTLDATSANEQKAKSTAPYPVSGTLGFAPHLNASLSTIKPGAEPVITTEIAQPVSETAMKEMRLSFQGFDLDITKGLTGCSSLEASFNACPPDSKLADVKAHSWVIPTPLEGALYLGEGAKSAFMTLNGPIALAVNGDIDIDAVKGSVSVNIDQGLPPISGSRIAATVGKGLFKVPSKTKPLKIALNTTSYANQTSSESVCVANCVSVEGNKGIKFSAKLKPTRQSSSADALFTVLHKDKKVSQPIKNLTVGLGRTKKTSLKFSRKRLKRLTRKRSARRRGASFGRLTLTPTKGKSFKFTLRAKKTGTLRVSANRAQKRKYTKAVSKAKKRYREAKGKKRKSAKKSYTRAKKNLSAYRRFERQITKKIKGKLQSRKLTVTRIPESIRISSKTLKFKRVMVRLAGKRGGVLKNPKVKKVTFSATSKPYKGSSMKAKSTVRLGRAEKAKRARRKGRK